MSAAKQHRQAKPPAPPPPAPDWSGRRIETWPIDRLKPYDKNARKHSVAQINQIQASLREFGWTIPILAREDGTVIAGHGRLRAGIAEGIKEVPVIVATGWSEAQCRAYAIADNRLSENSEWDKELLKLELGDLRTGGFDPRPLAFDDKALAKLKIVLPGDAPPTTATRNLNAIIQFNIVFDDELQQQAWFDFVRRLKAKYPTEETLGARLARHMAYDAERDRTESAAGAAG